MRGYSFIVIANGECLLFHKLTNAMTCAKAMNCKHVIGVKPNGEKEYLKVF